MFTHNGPSLKEQPAPIITQDKIEPIWQPELLSNLNRRSNRINKYVSQRTASIAATALYRFLCDVFLERGTSYSASLVARTDLLVCICAVHEGITYDDIVYLRTSWCVSQHCRARRNVSAVSSVMRS